MITLVESDQLDIWANPALQDDGLRSFGARSVDDVLSSKWRIAFGQWSQFKGRDASESFSFGFAASLSVYVACTHGTALHLWISPDLLRSNMLWGEAFSSEVPGPVSLFSYSDNHTGHLWIWIEKFWGKCMIHCWNGNQHGRWRLHCSLRSYTDVLRLVYRFPNHGQAVRRSSKG